jgi:cysteinyl-tRNA synthetase
MVEVPEEVRRLAAERDERRRARDFSAADALRERIAELGFRVEDSPAGATLEPVPRPSGDRLRPQQVPSTLDVEPRFDVSVHWLVEGWPDDVARGIDAFRRHAGARDVQYVVSDVTGTAPSFDSTVEVVSLVEGTGWASARNAGLRRSLGRIVIVVDGSIEPTGDVFGPLENALDDPSVGVCGPFGIVTHDLRSFRTSAGPVVDAVEGYLMAFRREVIATVGGFDERFRWYRSADIELSFRIKDAGFRALVVDVPVRRHEHRMWQSASDDERDRWSKRNFNRFLDRFRGRFDLTVEPGEAEREPEPGQPGEDGA